MSETPDGWVDSTLGDVAIVLDARRIPLNARERATRPGPYPYYGANGQAGTIDDYLFEGDHILLAEDGGYFDNPDRPNAYPVTGRFWVNNHAHILRTTDRASLPFLLHLLNATDLMPYVSGITRLKLTQADMRRIPVPLPPLPEQRRIVARIEALFARIRRARADLERIAALTRQHEAQALASLVEDEGSGSPMRCLHELLLEPAANGISIRGSDEPPGTPALRLDALTPHGLDLTRRRFIDIPESAVTRLTIRENDFLVSRGNGSLRLLARGAFAHAPATPTVFPDTMIRLRFRPDLVCPAWLTLAWRSAAVRKQVEQKAKTTAGIWKVSQIDLGSIELRVPTLKQQRLMATFLQRRLDTVAFIEGQSANALALLDRLERSILARAFRGELVPQEASDSNEAPPVTSSTARRQTARQPGATEPA